MKDIFQFLKVIRQDNLDNQIIDEILNDESILDEAIEIYSDNYLYDGSEVMSEDSMEEPVQIAEAMDFKSTFDDLKKGDTVKIKYGSSISKQQEGTFKVTFKSIVGKSKVGKITLVKQGEGAAKVKHYLYDRDGKVSMAMGDMGANMTRLVKESLDEKAPKIDLDKYAAHMNRNKKAVRKTSASQDYIKDVQKRSNKMGEAISMKNSINQYYYQDPKGVVQAVGSKDAMRKMNIKQAKDGNKGGSFSINHKKYKVGDQIKESVELNELSAEEKKLINTMYDKKGNLTPMGKNVMDHGKKNADRKKAVKVYKDIRKGKYPGVKFAKESVELDEASEEGKIRVIDLSDAHPDNRMGAKEKSGYQVQRMTKGKFVNQGKPYKKYADAKKVQQGTGQHSMQFEEKSGTGYELYHKDFSGAMGHAYAHAKKKFNITVDSDEIDDKVAMGPRKPGNGKTNTYRLKGDKGNIQVQVYNRGGSKPFELNMYKESVELDESKWEYQDARGVTKTGSLSKTVERQGTDVSYIFKGDDGKTDVVSGSRLKKMKKIKESVIDEAKTPELKGNPFKYYKKPTNKKEAQSNVNFWHYVGMADNDEIEDMGKIPANYKSYAKSMKQDAQRELKKMNEAVVLDEASLIPQLQTIVKDKQHAKIKGMIVDTFTASMITQIYSKVNDANKAKMDKLPLEKLVNIAHKMMKK